MSRQDASVGGTQTYTLGLAARLQKLGCLATIVGFGPPGEWHGVDFESVSLSVVRSNVEFHRRLRTWAHRHAVDSASVVDAQRPDFLSAFLGRRTQAVLVCTLHGNPLLGVRSHRPVLYHAYRRLERDALVAAKRVISVSESAMRRYVARYPFISRKASVIPVGVDLDTFKPLDRARARARLELPEGPVVLYAGRLEAEKRVHVLFDAIDMLDDPPLVLVAGAGTLYTELRRKTSGRRIRFLGNVAHDEMARVIAASNVLVIPSAFEGTPTIAVEAMACGVPVIATPVGDLPLIVKPGKTGFLFDGRAESLGRLLAKRLSSMGPFRQECINTGSLFGWDRIAREVLEVLGNAAS